MNSPWARLLLAGLLGGIVRVLTLQEKGRQAIGSILVGMICALYLSPLPLPLLETVLGQLSIEQDVEGLSGFLTGIGGTTLAHVILRAYQMILKRLHGGDTDA